jgi:hypothetical protein
MNTQQPPDMLDMDWNVRVTWRGILACRFLACAILLQPACAPITYNRNAPILNIEDSANGNTVPLVGP